MTAAGYREVRVPLLGLEDAGKLLIIGDADSSTLMFCTGGFPDDHRAFLPLGRRLADECGCLVGVSCLPEFDTDGSAPLLKPDGYSGDEMAKCLGDAVAALKSESTNDDAELVIMLHDWGVAPGIIFTNRCIKEDNAWLPKRAGAGEAAVTDKKGRKLVASCWTAPAKLVVFDVLPPAKSMKDGNELPADSYYELLVHLVYRAFFAMAFVLSRLYNHAAMVFFGVGAAVIFGVFGRWLNPTSALDGVKGKGASISRMTVLPRICYPYYHMFKEMFTGGALVEEFTMPSLDRVRMLYMYGETKNTNFHTKSALAAIEAGDGSEVVAVAGAGHWLYLQQPGECFNHVKRFLGKQ